MTLGVCAVGRSLFKLLRPTSLFTSSTPSLISERPGPGRDPKAPELEFERNEILFCFGVVVVNVFDLQREHAWMLRCVVFTGTERTVNQVTVQMNE